MRIALSTAMIGLGLVMALGSGWGQSEPGTTPAKGAGTKSRINAALMLSGGESSRCQLGNINDAYVVMVSATNNPKLTRYISGGGQSCTVLPIIVRIGTQINITGVLQDTAAIPGGAPAGDLASVSEDCFNVEGFSVGLAADSGSEFDPLDPANIINAQGYGFFWYDSDIDLKPGPFSYTVVGCAGHNCPTATTYFNTDSMPTSPSCMVLKPFPTVVQK